MTEDEEQVLLVLTATEVVGFPAGHNHWPYGELEWGGRFIPGEVFDSLLRRGYADAAELPEHMKGELQVSNNPDDPDIRPSHRIYITEKGRAWLQDKGNSAA